MRNRTLKNWRWAAARLAAVVDKHSHHGEVNMYVSWFSWGSPVGIGIFLASIGIFFWGLFSGVAMLNKSKDSSESRK
jgi:hypothetical protein